MIGTKKQKGEYGEPLTSQRGHLLLSLWQLVNGKPEEVAFVEYSNWVSKNLDFVAVSIYYIYFPCFVTFFVLISVWDAPYSFNVSGAGA